MPCYYGHVKSFMDALTNNSLCINTLITIVDGRLFANCYTYCIYD